MSITEDPITLGLLEDGEPIVPHPKNDAAGKTVQPTDRAGVIKVSKPALQAIKQFTQRGLSDRRYHFTNRDDPMRYRPFYRSDTAERRDHVRIKHRYKLPTRSYIPKTVILSDQPVLNVFDMTRPYLASAADDANPTPVLTIEEGIPESWERPARLSRMAHLKTSRHHWHKQVSKALDSQVPYRDHIVDIKKVKKKVAQDGIFNPRAKIIADLLASGAAYSGIAVPGRPSVMPVTLP